MSAAASSWSPAPRTDLLRVDTASDAGAALAAVRDIRLFDRRHARWAVLNRAVLLVLLWPAVAFHPSLVPSPVWAVTPLLALGLMIPMVGWLTERRAGAEVVDWRAFLATMLGCAVVIAVSWAIDQPAVLGALGGVAFPWVLHPLEMARRRRYPERPTWPPGSEPFAVLSVLAVARWVHPRRLAELTVMPVDVCGGWVRELRRHGMVGGPGSRAWTGIHLTAGREQLTLWRAELEALAASDR